MTDQLERRGKSTPEIHIPSADVITTERTETQTVLAGGTQTIVTDTLVERTDASGTTRTETMVEETTPVVSTKSKDPPVTYDDLMPLVEHNHIHLVVQDAVVRRLNDDTSPIRPDDEAAFVATAKFVLAETGADKLRDRPSCKNHVAANTCFLEIDSRGVVSVPGASTAVTSDLAKWLAKHYDFTFLFNGSATGPFLPKAEQNGSTHGRPPWIRVINTSWIRTQVFEVDVEITPAKRVPEKVKPANVLVTKGDVHLADNTKASYRLEVAGSYDSTAVLANKEFRIPLASPELDAVLVLTIGPATKP